ncbi:MAG: isoleucyl-tRNA synthetase [Parcubacteria group bacterium Gr01-1014_2]|nr:MAG: isoleucyl-tRNA synthetase [Parcubacteria group bacterium Gr01-1014_2]
MEFNLTKIEEKIQKFWEASNIPEKILGLRKGKRKFVFYEGPPTANGLPHIGHFLTRAFKDLFIRYKTMQGFFVPRRAGWDTHGLPVEIEVEKELGLKSKKEIEKYGIAEFNKKAKESVWRYKTEWEKFSKRIGFWLDFKNPYITYANDYIETLWHIVKQFDKKKFLYQGHKVLPWCPRCGTPLSSHEVALGYETITEDSVYVKFKIKNQKEQYLYHDREINTKRILSGETLDETLFILSWTTTPWTLPGNVALAVGEKIDYLVVTKDGENYILAKELAGKVITEPYQIEKELKGRDLVGLEYEPLFEIKKLKSDKSYKIYPADFVNTKEGTGMVHTAVMYGEDDYQLGEKIGLPRHHTIDKEGKFTKDVPEFAGKFVKGAEKDIVDYLQKNDLLFKVEPYTHEYPHCWRCKTALLYYATDSWFVKTTAVRKQLIDNNKKINWVPEYIKEGRFGQWLKEIKDWAFSRDRFWGTPLPVWVCTQTEKSKIQNPKSKTKGCVNYLVVGSLEELEKHRYKKPNQYFILRHSESTKNIGREINNTKLENDKYDLTEKGVERANKLAKDLKNKKIDLIFASPFLRTKRTAEIIAKELKLKIKIDERLKEMDHGSVCEGKDYYACVPKEEYPYKDFNTKFGLDGESRNDVRKRIFEFIQEVEEKHEGQNILIISHGDPLWLLEGTSKNLSEEDLFLVKKDQILGIKDETLSLVKLGELRTVAFKNLPRDEFGNLDLHRPYIDEVFLECPKCGNEMKRVPEVVDVWFDSGAMPFAQACWPFAQNQNFDFPADFITEGIDQTRGWFYTLLAVSTLLDFGPPYKNVISLGHVLDKDGKKMSKSIGNVVSPDYVIEKFGADAARWWFYRVNQAGESKSFREEELKEINNGFVRVLINSLRFWQLYSETLNLKRETAVNFHKFQAKSLLDRWLVSKFNSLIVSVTESLDEYDATTASREIEKFVIEDLSNWWIRRSRANFQLTTTAIPGFAREPSTRNNPQQDLLRFILLELAKLIAPFTPFLAEHLHEELHHRTTPGTVSVHFHDWPEANKKLIDDNLEKEMELVRGITSLGLAARKNAGIKVRQPLANLKVRNFQFSISPTPPKQLRLRRPGNFQKELTDLIKEEVNVKKVVFEKGEGDISVVLDTEISPALREEGWAREFIRMIQDARRDAGYEYDQKVSAHWFTEEKALAETIKREEEFIKKKTVLKELRQSRHDPKFVYDLEKEQELEPGRKIWLGLT